MKIEIGECPLGSKCEEAKGNVIVRCPWYTRVRGFEPNTGVEVDDWQCAIAWIPTLLINAANESRKNVAATESFRNEMVQQNNTSLTVASALLNFPKLNMRDVEDGPLRLKSSDEG